MPTLAPKAAFQSSITADQNAAELVLSPSGRLLALLDGASITVYNASTRTQMRQVALNASSALFSVEETFLYASDSSSMLRVRIADGSLEEVVAADPTFNQISQLTYSPDYKLIYFANKSALCAYSPLLSAIVSSPLNRTALCPVDYFFVDAASLTLVSSSYDCRLCAFSLGGWGEQTGNTTVAHCRVGGMAFSSGYALLAQDSITTQTPQVVVLHAQKLNIISYVNQSSATLEVHLLNLRNYILSFGRADTRISIYRDSITSKPADVHLPSKVISAGYSSQNNEIYLLLANDGDSLSIHTYTLTFNCSAIQNTLNTTLSLSETCSCKSSMLFDASREACSRSECLNTAASPCQCPHQESFDSFSLKCRLDCSQVYNAFTPYSFASPPRCACVHPFSWNPTLSDCSLIDCPQLANTVPSNASQGCRCNSGYFWDDADLSCARNSSSPVIGMEAGSSAPVGLIIGIIFLVLVVVLSGVIFYVKKYRRSEEDLPKTYEYPPKYEEHNPTPRPLAFENMVKTSSRLTEQDAPSP